MLDFFILGAVAYAFALMAALDAPVGYEDAAGFRYGEPDHDNR
jgi:hypothetical protein